MIIITILEGTESGFTIGTLQYQIVLARYIPKVVDRYRIVTFTN